jgi:hypothetical protein
MLNENESISQHLLRLLLERLGSAAPAVASTACDLAAQCEVALGPAMQQFIQDGLKEGAAQKGHVDFCAKVVSIVSSNCQPMLHHALQDLTETLQAAEEKERRRAAELVGRAFSAPLSEAAGDCSSLFEEFLRRFRDSNTPIRVDMIRWAATFLSQPKSSCKWPDR